MSGAIRREIAPDIAATAAEWFARLQEDETTEQDFQQWQVWLKASADHQRAFREIEQAWRLIGEVRPSPWASPGELQSARSGVERRRIIWALAASVLIMVAASLVPRYLGFGNSGGYSTATAEQRSVLLSDGSRVTLGARSRITPQLAGSVRRIVLEYGEAFFEVAHDPLRPFTVMVRGNEIRAIGTAFNVRASDDGVFVSVTEGRIAVVPDIVQTARAGDAGVSGQPLSKNLHRSSAEIILSSGQQAVLGVTGRVEQQEKPPAEVATWRQGRFEYRGETLRQVVEDLNRYTERPLVLDDESVGMLRYSGTVLPDHLDEWLEGIGGVLPVVVEDVGGKRRIRRAQ